MLDALDGLAPGRALDLGCGNGRHAMWLAERGWSVTAVDFSTEALRQARERAAATGVGVDWVEADLATYDPAPQAFDLVLVAYLHVAGGERPVFAKAAAAVARGGTLLIVGHDVGNVATGAPGPTDRSLLHTPSGIVAELPELEIERAEQVRRPTELEDGTSVEAVDALVLATRR